MKKAISMFGLLALLFAAISVATVATSGDDAANTKTWTGWISDSHCGAKGMSADHKACAMTCIKNGSKWVFVNGADKKVIDIKNQDAVNPDQALGHQVKLTGHLEADGGLQVDSIVPAT
jgi:hypothetical protein